MSSDQGITQKKSLFLPVLIVGLIVLSFVTGTLWQKVKQLEAGAGRVGTTAGVATENKLSIDNLKEYAKELKLDTKKFDACLDDGSKKELVDRQVREGSGEGVTGTPGFFLNGHLIAGALPFDVFKELIDYELATGFDSGATLPVKIQGYVDQGYIRSDKKEVKTEGQVKGPESAKITLVEYSDFECPYCVRAFPTVKQIIEAYPNDVRLIYKQFPLTSIHPNAQKAAEASECAADQGKFWEYHDKLFGSAS